MKNIAFVIVLMSTASVMGQVRQLSPDTCEIKYFKGKALSVNHNIGKLGVVGFNDSPMSLEDCMSEGLSHFKDNEETIKAVIKHKARNGEKAKLVLKR